MIWARRRDKKSGERQAEVFSRRLVEVLDAANSLEIEDPEAVEARIRNLRHGSGGSDTR
jgi:hypothetical protein